MTFVQKTISGLTSGTETHCFIMFHLWSDIELVYEDTKFID